MSLLIPRGPPGGPPAPCLALLLAGGGERGTKPPAGGLTRHGAAPPQIPPAKRDAQSPRSGSPSQGQSPAQRSQAAPNPPAFGPATAEAGPRPSPSAWPDPARAQLQPSCHLVPGRAISDPTGRISVLLPHPGPTLSSHCRGDNSTGTPWSKAPRKWGEKSGQEPRQLSRPPQRCRLGSSSASAPGRTGLLSEHPPGSSPAGPQHRAVPASAAAPSGTRATAAGCPPPPSS